MANTKGSDNPFPSVLFEEHVDPSNPASGFQRLFVDTDHLLKLRDSAGTVTTFGTGSLSDPMTTRGDLIYRNASNVTARLGRGSASQVLTSDGTDIAWAAPASGGLASGRAARTAGDLTTTSTTFVDATSMSVTLTTGAHSCLIAISAVSEISSSPNDVCLDIDVDGTRIGGTFGVHTFQHNASGRRANQGFAVSCAALSAASHTFKLQWRVTGGTGTLYAGSSVPLIMTVLELPV